MIEVNVTELRNHLPKYLSCAQKGEEIIVTLHGQIIARIEPPTDVKNEAIKQLKELRKRSKIGDVISPINVKWDAEK